jgi:hypothetical protein
MDGYNYTARSNHSKERRQDASQCVSLVYARKDPCPNSHNFQVWMHNPKDSEAMGSEREEYAMLRGKNALQCAMMLLYAQNQASPHGISYHTLKKPKLSHNLSSLRLRFLVFRISFLYLCFFIFSRRCRLTLMA